MNPNEITIMMLPSDANPRGNVYAGEMITQFHIGNEPHHDNLRTHLSITMLNMIFALIERKIFLVV